MVFKNGVPAGWQAGQAPPPVRLWSPFGPPSQQVFGMSIPQMNGSCSSDADVTQFMTPSVSDHSVMGPPPTPYSNKQNLPMSANIPGHLKHPQVTQPNSGLATMHAKHDVFDVGPSHSGGATVLDNKIHRSPYEQPLIRPGMVRSPALPNSSAYGNQMNNPMIWRQQNSSNNCWPPQVPMDGMNWQQNVHMPPYMSFPVELEQSPASEERAATSAPQQMQYRVTALPETTLGIIKQGQPHLVKEKEQLNSGHAVPWPVVRGSDGPTQMSWASDQDALPQLEAFNIAEQLELPVIHNPSSVIHIAGSAPSIQDNVGSVPLGNTPPSFPPPALVDSSNSIQMGNPDPAAQLPNRAEESSAAPADKPKRRRRKRCGGCPPCMIKEDCGECYVCKNKGQVNAICKLRKCMVLRKKAASDRAEKSTLSSGVLVSNSSEMTSSSAFNVSKEKMEFTPTEQYDEQLPSAAGFPSTRNVSPLRGVPTCGGLFAHPSNRNAELSGDTAAFEQPHSELKDRFLAARHKFQTKDVKLEVEHSNKDANNCVEHNIRTDHRAVNAEQQASSNSGHRAMINSYDHHPVVNNGDYRSVITNYDYLPIMNHADHKAVANNSQQQPVINHLERQLATMQSDNHPATSQPHQRPVITQLKHQIAAHQHEQQMMMGSNYRSGSLQPVGPPQLAQRYQPRPPKSFTVVPHPPKYAPGCDVYTSFKEDMIKMNERTFVKANGIKVCKLMAKLLKLNITEEELKSPHIVKPAIGREEAGPEVGKPQEYFQNHLSKSGSEESIHSKAEAAMDQAVNDGSQVFQQQERDVVSGASDIEDKGLQSQTTVDSGFSSSSPADQASPPIRFSAEADQDSQESVQPAHDPGAVVDLRVAATVADIGVNANSSAIPPSAAGAVNSCEGTETASRYEIPAMCSQERIIMQNYLDSLHKPECMATDSDTPLDLSSSSIHAQPPSKQYASHPSPLSGATVSHAVDRVCQPNEALTEPNERVESTSNGKETRDTLAASEAAAITNLVGCIGNNKVLDPPSCPCNAPPYDENIEGPFYTHLGSAPTVAGVRSMMEARCQLSGSAIRIEKIRFTGKEGKTSIGCPAAKWIVRRSSIDEKVLVLVRHRPGHHCTTAWLCIAIVVWEGIPGGAADHLYDYLTRTMPVYGYETERRCGTNQPKSCACQGWDTNRRGASFSFGCSWSVYYNGCKFARSQIPRKFKLRDVSFEGVMESKFQALTQHLAPLYKKMAPQSYTNQTRFEKTGGECRLGFRPGRPWSGVTATVDFCAHQHRDSHNMNNGCTTVVTLTKHRGLSKAPDEQLHTLPLYVMEGTDEHGSQAGLLQRVQQGSVEILSRFTQEQRRRAQPYKRRKKGCESYQSPKVKAAFLQSLSKPQDNLSASAQKTQSGAPITSCDPAGINSAKQYLFSTPEKSDQSTEPTQCAPQVAQCIEVNHAAPNQTSLQSASGFALYSGNQLQPDMHRPAVVSNASPSTRAPLFHAPSFGQLRHPNASQLPSGFSANLIPQSLYQGTHDAQFQITAPGNQGLPREDNPFAALNMHFRNSDAFLPIMNAKQSEERVPSCAVTHSAAVTEAKPTASSHSECVENSQRLDGNQMVSQLPVDEMSVEESMDELDENDEALKPPKPCPPSPEFDDPERRTVHEENSHLFQDPDLGGVAIALSHGSVLFEVAKRELHATTALKNPDRYNPTRISLVFYQHKRLNYKKHGWYEYLKAEEERKLARKLAQESGIEYIPKGLKYKKQRQMQAAGTLCSRGRKPGLLSPLGSCIRKKPGRKPGWKAKQQLRFAAYQYLWPQAINHPATCTTSTTVTRWMKPDCCVTGPYQKWVSLRSSAKAMDT